MSDVRLIDANVLPNYKCQVTATIGDRKGPAEMRFVFWQDIEKAPTIDAVPVVRCRECKYARPLVQEEWVACIMWGRGSLADGFCHMGEKMDAKDVDVPTKDQDKICTINGAPCNECIPGAPCAKMDGGADK